MVSPQGLRSAWLLVPWRHAYDPPDCCVCWKQFHSSPRREVRPLPGVAQPTVQVTAPSWSPPPPPRSCVAREALPLLHRGPQWSAECGLWDQASPPVCPVSSSIKRLLNFLSQFKMSSAELLAVWIRHNPPHPSPTPTQRASQVLCLEAWRKLGAGQKPRSRSWAASRMADPPGAGYSVSHQRTGIPGCGGLKP